MDEHPERRSGDSPTHQDISDALDSIAQQVQDNYEQFRNHSHDEISELIDYVVGPKRPPIQGEGRVLEEGLLHQVARLNEQLSNGGLKIRLPAPLWVAIVTAVAGIVVQLIASLGA